MTGFGKLLASAAFVASLFGAGSAQALTFQLIDYNGSVANTPAMQGFQIAADYWSSIITSNVTVRLEIGYTGLASGVIGQTQSTKYGVSTSDVYAALAATGTSQLDHIAVSNLTPLTAAGGLQMITSGYKNDATKTGVDVTKKVFDADNSANNTTMGVNSATLKALGISVDPTQRDARITFSSNFNFDFNPSDGISGGSMDFIGVAIHEIGHALGFTSGVSTYDDTANANANVNGSSNLFSTLDLFRYSTDPTGVAPGTGSWLDESVGGHPFFSIDSETPFASNSYFSTGATQGDGRQASHWKDGAGCTAVGIMDPTWCTGQMGAVTDDDIAAMDALGWNVGIDAMTDTLYKMTTSDIYDEFTAPPPTETPTAAPEPSSWALMLIGFGLVGGAIRRRSIRVRVALR
jgi:hypothetical protein